MTFTYPNRTCAAFVALQDSMPRAFLYQFAMKEKTMQITLLHYAAPPVVGGVESVLGHHAHLLVEDGYQVQIVAGRGAQTDERIQFIHMPLADSRHPDILAVKSALDLGEIPPAFEQLTRQIRQKLEKITSSSDVIIAHNVCSLAKNLPLTAALWEISQKNSGPHLVLWHHDLAWTTPRYQSELHDGDPWDLLRRDWPDATQVVVSRLRQAELAKLIDVPLERVQVVPNGVEIEKFLKLGRQSQQLMDQLELLQAWPILLMPVRITPRKNLEMGLRILAELRAAFPQAASVVTGPLGPHNPANITYFNMLTQLRERLGLGDRAHFLAEHSQDYLPDEVIFDFYRVADALLMPSREEGFGIPILEAGLAGIPVFSSDIQPLVELGGDHINTFSPDETPQAAAALIAQQLEKDPTFHLRVQVRNQYTWEQIYHKKIRPLLSNSLNVFSQTIR